MASRKKAAGGAAAPAKRSASKKKSAAEVLAAERRDIADARALCRSLVAELRFAGEESEAIEDAIAQSSETDKRRQAALMRAITLSGRAAVMRELAGATKALIELERAAFDLSAADESEPETGQSSALDSIAAELARLAAPEKAEGEA